MFTIVGLQELRNLNISVGNPYLREIWIKEKRITELSNLNANRVCTTFISDMSYIFTGYNSFNEDISSWDVSNVNNMNGMFFGASSFNQDISSWDVINVTDCDNFSSHTPLTEANTPNFTNCTNY